MEGDGGGDVDGVVVPAHVGANGPPARCESFDILPACNGRSLANPLLTGGAIFRSALNLGPFKTEPTITGMWGDRHSHTGMERRTSHPVFDVDIDGGWVSPSHSTGCDQDCQYCEDAVEHGTRTQKLTGC